MLMYEKNGKLILDFQNIILPKQKSIDAAGYPKIKNILSLFYLPFTPFIVFGRLPEKQ